MAPPDEPLDVDESVLPQVVAELGTELPVDFLAFARIYGHGAIHIHAVGEWEIWSPFSLSYLEQVKTFFEIHDEYRDACEVPMDLYPEKKGVLPCATDYQRGYLGWKTGGKPDKWKAVEFCCEEEPPATVHAMDFTQFIYQIITRKIVLKGMQEFEPWDPEVDVSFRPLE